MLEVVDLEEDFELFDRLDLVESSNITLRSLPSTQVSSNQEIANTLEAMVLQRKNTSLLKLLESHTGGSIPKVAVHPWPTTPLPSYISPAEPLEKKRKREKKGKEASEKGDIPPPKYLEPQKGTKAAKGPQRRNTAEGLLDLWLSD